MEIDNEDFEDNEDLEIIDFSQRIISDSKKPKKGHNFKTVKEIDDFNLPADFIFLYSEITKETKLEITKCNLSLKIIKKHVAY
jgi:hypothetical protein